MTVLKCCTQYASKFGKLRSGHRPGKVQFSFQSQRKAMSKNVQITMQLLSFHMLARLCSKSFKLGFSNMWPENFHMYKLDWERQNHQRSNCQHPMDHRKSKRVQEKHLLLLDYVKAFDYLKWSEVKSLSHVRHFVTTWTIAHQAAPSIHGIFQARILEWVAISFSRGIFPTQVSRIVGRHFYHLNHQGSQQTEKFFKR